MSKNENLCVAKQTANDEFYTRYEDIAEELSHYLDFFKGKTVYCPCDNPKVSNFAKYFIENFENLGLKRLICTGFNPNAAGMQLSFFDLLSEDEEHGFLLDMTSSTEKDFGELKYNGDFRNPENVELLKQSDIVVTNPPFSLFRDFIKLLEKYGKKYLVVGSQNALTYDEVFPLIKNNQLWMGYNMVHDFIQPDGSISTFGNICWFTNMDVDYRHEEIELTKNYSEADYQKYHNFNGINVDKVSDIPMDYDGVMGVPITFLNKYNPDQFELLGIDREFTEDGNRGLINGERKYARLFIRRKTK